VGAGPIGLSVILGARLFSPQHIIAIDLANSRLEAAKQFGATEVINNSDTDPLPRSQALTDGLGVDVAVEAVGLPPTLALCTRLIRPGGRAANLGAPGAPAPFPHEGLWIRNVTVTPGLVDTYSTPTLLRLTEAGRRDAAKFVTHRFKMSEFMEAYDTFSRAGETGALKVVVTRD